MSRWDALKPNGSKYSQDKNKSNKPRIYHAPKKASPQSSNPSAPSTKLSPTDNDQDVDKILNKLSIESRFYKPSQTYNDRNSIGKATNGQNKSLDMKTISKAAIEEKDTQQKSNFDNNDLYTNEYSLHKLNVFGYKIAQEWNHQKDLDDIHYLVKLILGQRGDDTPQQNQMIHNNEARHLFRLSNLIASYCRHSKQKGSENDCHEKNVKQYGKKDTKTSFSPSIPNNLIGSIVYDILLQYLSSEFSLTPKSEDIIEGNFHKHDEDIDNNTKTNTETIHKSEVVVSLLESLYLVLDTYQYFPTLMAPNVLEIFTDTGFEEIRSNPIRLRIFQVLQSIMYQTIESLDSCKDENDTCITIYRHILISTSFCIIKALHVARQVDGQLISHQGRANEHEPDIDVRMLLQFFHTSCKPQLDSRLITVCLQLIHAFLQCNPDKAAALATHLLFIEDNKCYFGHRKPSNFSSSDCTTKRHICSRCGVSHYHHHNNYLNLMHLYQQHNYATSSALLTPSTLGSDEDKGKLAETIDIVTSPPTVNNEIRWWIFQCTNEMFLHIPLSLWLQSRKENNRTLVTSSSSNPISFRNRLIQSLQVMLEIIRCNLWELFYSSNSSFSPAISLQNCATEDVKRKIQNTTLLDGLCSLMVTCLTKIPFAHIKDDSSNAVLTREAMNLVETIALFWIMPVPSCGRQGPKQEVCCLNMTAMDLAATSSQVVEKVNPEKPENDGKIKRQLTVTFRQALLRVWVECLGGRIKPNGSKTDMVVPLRIWLDENSFMNHEKSLVMSLAQRCCDNIVHGCEVEVGVASSSTSERRPTKMSDDGMKLCDLDMSMLLTTLKNHTYCVLATDDNVLLFQRLIVQMVKTSPVSGNQSCNTHAANIIQSFLIGRIKEDEHHRHQTKIESNLKGQSFRSVSSFVVLTLKKLLDIGDLNCQAICCFALGSLSKNDWEWIVQNQTTRDCDDQYSVNSFNDAAISVSDLLLPAISHCMDPSWGAKKKSSILKGVGDICGSSSFGVIMFEEAGKGYQHHKIIINVLMSTLYRALLDSSTSVQLMALFAIGNLSLGLIPNVPSIFDTYDSSDGDSGGCLKCQVDLGVIFMITERCLQLVLLSEIEADDKVMVNAIRTIGHVATLHLCIEATNIMRLLQESYNFNLHKFLHDLVHTLVSKLQSAVFLARSIKDACQSSPFGGSCKQRLRVKKHAWGSCNVLKLLFENGLCESPQYDILTSEALFVLFECLILLQSVTEKVVHSALVALQVIPLQAVDRIRMKMSPNQYQRLIGLGEALQECFVCIFDSFDAAPSTSGTKISSKFLIEIERCLVHMLKWFKPSDAIFIMQSKRLWDCYNIQQLYHWFIAKELPLSLLECFVVAIQQGSLIVDIRFEQSLTSHFSRESRLIKRNVSDDDWSEDEI